MTLTRLFIATSIEDRILRLREKKRLISEATVGQSNAALAKLTEADLKFLFSLGDGPPVCDAREMSGMRMSVYRVVPCKTCCTSVEYVLWNGNGLAQCGDLYDRTMYSFDRC